MPSNTRTRSQRLWAPCADPDALHQWVQEFLGLRIPRAPVCAQHSAPFEYLKRAYFDQPHDMVVWAPRGGGKTRLGAIATLLDLLHRPGCEVRILGGSLEQSLRMWEHLLPDVERLAKRKLVGKAKARRIRLSSGSGAGVVTQSQRAVRGLRVQKLRCDEVEMFDPKVWEAAQLVVRSKPAQPTRRGRLTPPIAGSIEAISTMHLSGGLMQRVVEHAQGSGAPVIHWCIMEVLERCPPQRVCDTCQLWNECRGVARHACDGFVSIDDAIALKRRVSAETWETEMLCRRPSTRRSVFSRFDPSVHVRQTLPGDSSARTRELWLGIDFGYVNPFVCLWIECVDGRITHVIDEYVQEMRTVEEHLAEIESRPWGRALRVACDPAGAGRNEQTAMSNVQLLRRRGYAVRFCRSQIVEGVEMIRAALHPAAGEPTLFVHPRCRHLIAALKGYRYGEQSELPIKDGVHDHLIDALRYYYVNRARSEAVVRRY